MLRGIARVLFLAGLVAPWHDTRAQAQAWVPEKGHGTFALAYQQLHTQWHTDAHGQKYDAGQIDTRTALLNLDYGLTDRLAFSASLPFLSNRYRGKSPHHPHRDLDDDHGQAFIDDSRYHGTWGDWMLGLRYRWREDPWLVTPFVYAGYPATDYATFSHAAAGAGVWSVTTGISVGKRLAPPRQNVWVQATYGYTWLERVVDRRIARSRFNLEAGYFFTPRFSARAFLNAQKTHNGFEQAEFRDARGMRRRDDHYFHHDLTQRTDFVNLGASASYLLKEQYALFANYSQSVWGENAHLIDHAVTVGISRSF